MNEEETSSMYIEIKTQKHSKIPAALKHKQTVGVHDQRSIYNSFQYPRSVTRAHICKTNTGLQERTTMPLLASRFRLGTPMILGEA